MQRGGAMDREVLVFLKRELDTIKRQNRATHALLQRHIRDDDKVHETVHEHALYWRIAIWAAVMMVGAGLSWAGLH